MSELSPNAELKHIGIDIGGTNTRIGLFSSLSSPNFTVIAKFPTQQDYDEQVLRIASSLRDNADQTIAGVGVSLAGRIARDGQLVAIAPNLPTYVGKPFVRDITRLVHCPVRLAHDPVCGLLAEKKYGALRDVERCAYLTVSTGTGAAIQLAKGALALTSSIEIGHQLLDGSERVCICGQVGCLETYTGGRQIAARYGHSPAEITDPAFWNALYDKLALGMVNLAMLTRIDAVAISGAIAANSPQLIEQVQDRIDRLDTWSHLSLLPAALGEDAPLIGSALLLETPEDTILH